MTIISSLWLLWLLFQISLWTSQAVGDDEAIDQPLVPEDLDTLRNNAYLLQQYLPPQDKLIPRNLFMAFREIPPENQMYSHVQKLLNETRAEDWSIHLMDKQLRDEFMNTYYHDTSTLWGYKLINELCHVAATDIWRYGKPVISLALLRHDGVLGMLHNIARL